MEDFFKNSLNSLNGMIESGCFMERHQTNDDDHVFVLIMRQILPVLIILADSSLSLEPRKRKYTELLYAIGTEFIRVIVVNASR